MVMMSLGFFKRVIVLFWALWWFLAFLTDFIGGMKLIGLIAAPGLPHQNYPALVASLMPYNVPAWLPPMLFIGIIVWALLSTALLAIAASTPMQPRPRWQRRVNSAFIVSLGLWLAFFLADQIVMKFQLEENHMVQGGFQLLCFMAIHLLPDDHSS